MTQKLVKLKRKLLIIVTINTLLITTPEFNKLTAQNLASRLAQANLITKTDLDNKLINLNEIFNS